MVDEQMQLHELQRTWSPGWRIWRGRRTTDVGAERTGDWYASRMDKDAGIYPTIGRSSAFLLHDALREQSEMVAAGRPPVDVGTNVRPGQ